jgi:hypothetical protein
LPHSSPISSPEAPTGQHELGPLYIRYAENDNDVIAIHKFLLAVAGPRLLAPVNVFKSLEEIIRITKHEVVIMAMRGDTLVGTMGLIKSTRWYSDEAFLTDRWSFCIYGKDHDGTAFALDAEAKTIAQGVGLRFVNAQENVTSCRQVPPGSRMLEISQLAEREAPKPVQSPPTS